MTYITSISCNPKSGRQRKNFSDVGTITFLMLRSSVFFRSPASYRVE